MAEAMRALAQIADVARDAKAHNLTRQAREAREIAARLMTEIEARYPEHPLFPEV